MRTITLHVEGMACEGCANAVRRSVSGLDGVSRVDVDLAGKRVAVAYDEVKTDEAAIRARIEDAGYDVVG